MEVSWISNTFEQFNGIAFYLKKMCPLLAERVELRLYTGRAKDGYPFEVKSLPHCPNPLFPDYDLIWPFFKFRGDVLHVHTPYGLGIASLSSQLPKVVTTHSLPHHIFEFMFRKEIPRSLLTMGWKYLTWFYNHFDRVVCQTRATEKMFRKHGLRAKTEVIPNGMDLEKFRHGNPDRFRKKYGIKGEFAMFLGRLDYTKRPEWIIEIAKNLREYKFLLVGFGPLEKVLFRPPNTVFLRSLSMEDKIDAYTAAAMLIMPSRIETEGIVAQEALACGTPVIIADNDVLDDIVGNAGFRCSDLKDMEEKVKCMFENGRLRSEMGVRAVQRVKERDISKSVNRLVELYEKLI